MDEQDLLRDLDRFIGSVDAVYTCGGTLALPSIAPLNPNRHVKENAAQSSTGEDDAASQSGNCILAPSKVSIRWERECETGKVLRFPGASQETIEMLANDSEPAVFGYDGNDVLDPSYRQALAMNTDKFDTNFCPYASGIIDHIKHILLPDIARVDDVDAAVIVAQLYKLNTQFASLVVCLPSAHAGGQLHVRHGGCEVMHDWSQHQDASSSVQWAAFYSDCEHEIRPVTDGHRITLTYNLYCRHWKYNAMRDLRKNPTAVHIQSIPLYERIRKTLCEPRFMVEGGVLGIFCGHAYPTRSEFLDPWTEKRMQGQAIEERESMSSHPPPVTLKGRDIVLFATFKHLGLGVKLRPVILHSGSDDDDDDEVMPDGSSNAWMGLVPGAIVCSDRGGEGDGEIDVLDDFGQYLRGVRWLQNASVSEEAAMVHLRYGNQADIGIKYGSLAIMVQVPPLNDRVRMMKGQ